MTGNIRLEDMKDSELETSHTANTRYVSVSMTFTPLF